MAYTPPTVQGRFTSTGNAQIVTIPSGFDWIQTYNLTQIAAGGAGVLQTYFQVGMANGTALAFSNSGATTLTQLAAPTGISFFDSSDMSAQLGAKIAITATTAGTVSPGPIFATGNTAGLVVGSIVRLYNVANGHSLDGQDFVVSTVVANTSFTLYGGFQSTPVTTAANTGSYRIVNYNSGPWAPWYPPYRSILNITRATSAVISLNVPSNYQVGQEVVFSIPAGFGMTELDGLTGTITAVVNTGAAPTITVNIDSTGFTAFTYPNTVSVKSHAIVAPVGANTGYILQQNPVGNILNDAVFNTEQVGALLAGGANSPAGANNDVIFWIAGKSANINNL